MDEKVLKKWCDNLAAAYKLLPPEVRKEFQPSCDGTLGRAIRSISPVLGEGHEVIVGIKSMVESDIPQSADDFHKKKWFQK